jgi:beta-glucanase (GH16 family)
VTVRYSSAGRSPQRAPGSWPRGIGRRSVTRSRDAVICHVSLLRAGARLVAVALVTLGPALACGGYQPAPVVSAPGTPQPTAWRLVWHDEFDGVALDTTKWVRETGGTGWGNGELEFYTNRVENARVANGYLVIEARREAFGNQAYTSARLKTQGLGAWQYGRIEARIQIPRGQGLWPAFWMLGDNIAQVGWPACGEIDIMENIGKEPSIVHGSIHGPGYTGADGIEAPYRLRGTRRFADDFHVFAVEWEPNGIRFYVDDDLYVSRSRADLRSGWKWVFDHPFFLLLNLAVGGDWPGNPDATTVFPQTMLVDYVRVYQRSSE